eukprot:11640266-Prorocentrum_lima.AAC.1
MPPAKRCTKESRARALWCHCPAEPTRHISWNAALTASDRDEHVRCWILQGDNAGDHKLVYEFKNFYNMN